mmetsp:Transcript_9570/g.30422  ORF Transcript_9570/g.30422 Transcript_9570/m.30422 type:complete len:143 (+) Transcript_9570:784-1212(+)
MSTTCPRRVHDVSTTCPTAARVTDRLHPADQATLSERVQAEMRERAARRAAALAEREEEALAGCTFAPTPGRPPPPRVPPGEARAIKGLSRHLERKELARRREEEQRAREAKAFNPDAVRSTTTPFTVPCPFSLSQSRAAYA